MGFQIFLHFFSCCITGFCKRQFSIQKHYTDFYMLSLSQKCFSGYCSIGIVPQMRLADMQLKTIQMQMSEKSGNSNSIILLFTQFSCLRFIRNTKEVSFFSKYTLFLKAFEGIWEHQFWFTLCNHHRKCYLGKKLWTAVSGLLWTYFKMLINNIGNVFQWNVWHSWGGWEWLSLVSRVLSWQHHKCPRQRSQGSEGFSSPQHNSALPLLSGTVEFGQSLFSWHKLHKPQCLKRLHLFCKN